MESTGVQCQHDDGVVVIVNRCETNRIVARSGYGNSKRSSDVPIDRKLANEMAVLREFHNFARQLGRNGRINCGAITGEKMPVRCQGQSQWPSSPLTTWIPSIFSKRSSSERFRRIPVLQRIRRLVTATSVASIVDKRVVYASRALKENAPKSWRDPSEWTGLNCSSASFSWFFLLGFFGCSVN